MRDLEKSGFERRQALAVLDFLWSVRNETLFRHPMRSGLLTGTVISLVIFGRHRHGIRLALQSSRTRETRRKMSNDTVLEVLERVRD